LVFIKLSSVELDGGNQMTLNKVCKAFEDWRANRSHRNEQIPEHLWVMVRALLPHYKRSTICKALHLSGGGFIRNCVDVKTQQPSVVQNDEFIEMLLPLPTADCTLTLQGARKTLSIKIPSQHLSTVLPLLEAYL
jgi:surfactin synthase thioesterase subunit